ncbi:unnamed protein product [Darwinula stevensoni]|uniref:Uncharacterized protein n=1 Tax=Darwinula stevensoni TaxID=69355 RepID=A0A7R8X660_9CRUS|nr:unnamed protein product [Darwinula stevensoni]CAG0885417.1 unnamed protein product [Darwinula stevensoni]
MLNDCQSMDETYAMRTTREGKGAATNAVEVAVRQYDDQMSRLNGDVLISEQELIEGDQKFRKEAVDSFSKAGSPWPQYTAKFKDELEKRLASRYEIYINERDAREKSAEIIAGNAVESAVSRYDIQLSELYGGAPNDEEELRNRLAGCRREAVATFLESGTRWPHLSEKHKGDLEKVGDAPISTRRDDRFFDGEELLLPQRLDERQETRTRDARELLNASEASVKQYDDRMSRLSGGHLIAERDLADGDEKFRKEAIESFSKTGPLWPQLSKKLMSNLEKRLQAGFELYTKERHASERAAEMTLRNAAAAAAGRYDVQLSRLCDGATSGEEELRSKNAEYRSQALAAFSASGAQCPHLSAKFKDELEKRLDDRYETRTRDAREVLNAVDAAARQYGGQMERLRHGPFMREQELNDAHQRHRRQALDSFAKKTKQYPSLAKKYQDRLEKVTSPRKGRERTCRRETTPPWCRMSSHRPLPFSPFLVLEAHPEERSSPDFTENEILRPQLVVEEFSKHRKHRDALERGAEDSLALAVDSAARGYAAQMTRLVAGPAIVAEHKLRNGHLEHSKQALRAVSEAGRKFPHLSKKHADDLTQRLAIQYEKYAKERDAREKEAETKLQNAVERAANEHDARLSRWCEEALVGEEALASEEALKKWHQECRKRAIASFSEDAAQCPQLSGKFKDELENCLDENYDMRTRRFGELLHAMETAVKQYDDGMSRWRAGHLIGEQDLVREDEKLRKEAIDAFSKVESQWPQLSTKLTEELKKRLKAGSELYLQERDARETAAAMKLRNAMVSIASQYDIQLRKSCEENYISEEELMRRNAEYRRQALAAFMKNAVRWPHLSNRFEDEMEKHLDEKYETSTRDARVLMNAVEAAVQHYGSLMEQLCEVYHAGAVKGEGVEVSVVDAFLDRGHEQSRKQATGAFSKKAEEYHHSLSNKYLDQLEKIIGDDFEKHKGLRDVESAVARYNGQMTELLASITSRQELQNEHARHCGEALGALSERGKRDPRSLTKNLVKLEQAS